MSGAAVQNLIISLGAMQMARRIPFDDPVVLNYVRAIYVGVQLIILAVYYYISSLIKSKNDQTVLKYVEPAAPMSGETEGKLVTTTVRDYDLAEISKLLRACYTGLAMMAGMHLYMKFTQPLFVQSLMGLKGLYDAKLVSIYLLNKPAVGDLARPFKVQSMFGGAAAGPQTDAKSIAEAEKKVGKKEN